MEIVVYKGIGVFVLFFSLKFTSVVNIVRKRHGDCCFQYCKQAVAFHYSIFAQYISQMCKPKKKRWPTPSEKSAGHRHFILIRRDTIPIDQAAAYRILPLSAAIPRVSLHGIDNAVFTFFYNAHMIRFSITLPVEEDDHTGCRFNGIIRPLATLLKPVGTIDTTGKFGDHTGINITTLVGAPGHEAGTPFHTAAVSFSRISSLCFLPL